MYDPVAEANIPATVKWSLHPILPQANAPSRAHLRSPSPHPRVIKGAIRHHLAQMPGGISDYDVATMSCFTVTATSPVPEHQPPPGITINMGSPLLPPQIGPSPVSSLLPKGVIVGPAKGRYETDPDLLMQFGYHPLTTSQQREHVKQLCRKYRDLTFAYSI